MICTSGSFGGARDEHFNSCADFAEQLLSTNHASFLIETPLALAVQPAVTGLAAPFDVAFCADWIVYVLEEKGPIFYTLPCRSTNIIQSKAGEVKLKNGLPVVRIVDWFDSPPQTLITHKHFRGGLSFCRKTSPPTHLSATCTWLQSQLDQQGGPDPFHHTWTVLDNLAGMHIVQLSLYAHMLEKVCGVVVQDLTLFYKQTGAVKVPRCPASWCDLWLRTAAVHAVSAKARLGGMRNECTNTAVDEQFPADKITFDRSSKPSCKPPKSNFKQTG